MRETDLADELFGQPGGTALPAGVRVATARQGGVTITRVEISREGLARPRGRYVTLEVPSVSLLCSSLHDAVLLRFDVRHSFHLLGYL